MKYSMTFLITILISLSSVFGQVSTMLATVTEGDAFNSAGLGVTFTNRLMPDGDLYFRGSKDGLTEAVWRTDGTVTGTRKILEEGPDFGGNWFAMFFVEGGVLLRGSDGYKFLSDDDNELTTLASIPDEFLNGLTQLPNGNYTFTTEVDDVYNLYIATSDFGTVTEVADVHPEGSEILAFGGNEGVLIYNGNSFQESFPVVYDYDSGITTPLDEYMAQYSLTLSDLSEGFVYGDFMFLSYRDGDNFFRDHVINMATGAVADFTFLRAPYTVHEYGDKFVFVASRDAIVFDPSDLSHQFLYEDVFSLGTSRVVGDELFFIAENADDMEQVVVSDLTNGSFRFLERAITGRFFYNCVMLDYEDEFYYLSEGEAVTLMKYDFSSNTPVFVDSLSVVTGATVVHDLHEVNGELVFSKRLGFLQHEPFVLGNGGTTSVVNLTAQELIVAPTVSSEIITIMTEDQGIPASVHVFDTAGKSFGYLLLDGKQIYIGDLPEGLYYGILTTEEVSYKITFMKI